MNNDKNMVLIDGSYGEGGGQIIRTALALSAMTGTPFCAEKIRAGRNKPGLKSQHLAAVKAFKEICKAKTSPVAIGTSSFSFNPGPVLPGTYTVDIGTAGSISLLLQALMYPLLFGNGASKLHLTGGTCGLWQAPVEFSQHVLLPYLECLADAKLKLKRRGYYPKGGGKVKLETNPKFHFWKSINGCRPLNLTEKGEPISIQGISHASESLRRSKIADRQAAAAREVLKSCGLPVNIKVDYHPTLCPGSGMIFWVEHQSNANPNRLISGIDGLGKRGKKAERVGEEIGKKLLSTINSPYVVDEYLSDQLIPLMGLLPGSKMAVPMVSDHLVSNIYVVEQFLPVKFAIEDQVVSSLPA